MNKHLPSDIESLTRKELVEIYHIHVEEFKALSETVAQKDAEIAELEKQLKPRLFWDADNTETSYDSVCELMQAKFDDGLSVGGVVEIQRAALLPNETYVLTKIIGDYDFEYELKGGDI